MFPSTEIYQLHDNNYDVLSYNDPKSSWYSEFAIIFIDFPQVIIVTLAISEIDWLDKKLIW